MKKMEKLKKTTKIRIISFSLALLALTGGFWLDSYLSLQATQTRLEYVYRRALGDLADSVHGMQSTLQKAMYAGTASMQSSISAQLLEQSGGAKTALAALPFSQEKAERVSRFLSQAGDFSLALSRKAYAGEPLDQSDLDTLTTLREYAAKLTGALTGIQARLTAEGENVTHTVSLLNNVSEIEEMALLDDDFDEVAKEFSAFPTLLYDGPFSDHIQRRSPLLLENMEGVTRDQAKKIARDFLGSDTLTFAGEGGGNLPVYSFTADGSMVNITLQGGQPAYFKKAGAVKSAKLSYTQALRAAREYLSGLGLPPMTESYYVINDNLCAINFHTSETTADGQTVLCYPDLVKVVVELEQGGAVEFDSTGYLMNHHDRRLAAPELTRQEAEKSLSPALKADSASLAVIPSPGLYEILCWEFHCTAADGTEVLCYVNAQTGLEEQLYILQKDKHGILAV